MQKILLYLCIFIFLYASFIQCQNEDGDDDEDDPNELKYDEHGAEVTKEVFKNYNHLVRPCGKDSEGKGGECKPVEVRANMKILGISAVDDDKMHFSMQLLFRQEWNDHRLKHTAKSDLALDPNEQQTRVWTPDTFFVQEKEGYKPLTQQPNNQYLIAPSGKVVFSSRLSITLSCPMDLRRYPFDEQSCGFQFGSYSQPHEHVVYKWDETRGVEVAPDVRPTTPHFSLGEIVKKKDCKHEWMTGTYSCLKVEIHFIRRVGFSDVMKNFVPSFVLVLLSWVAFFLGSDNAGIRALLGAGCLQFLLIHWSILSLHLPQVAGYRAIDIWFIACIFFVGLSLLQLLLVIRSPSKRRTISDVEMDVLERIIEEPPVKTVTRVPNEGEGGGRRMSVVKPVRKYTRLVAKDSARGLSPPPKDSMMMPTSQYYEEPMTGTRKISMMDKYRRMSTREKVDAISCFLFPFLFILFNIVFWAHYSYKG